MKRVNGSQEKEGLAFSIFDRGNKCKVYTKYNLFFTILWKKRVPMQHLVLRCQISGTSVLHDSMYTTKVSKFAREISRASWQKNCAKTALQRILKRAHGPYVITLQGTDSIYTAKRGP
jgi:hypothetical protein